MVDTMLEYAIEERWDNATDQHLVVRETPAAKVRENIARLRQEILRTKLEKEFDAIHRELEAIHRAENLDENLLPVVEATKAPWKQKLDVVLDGIAVTICRYSHRFPDTIRPSDTYLTCVACGRKYAFPWADPKKLPAGVYSYNDFVAPTERTQQAELRSKAHARII